MTTEMTDCIIGIISKNILTPVIYMIEADDMLNFICFCDRNITMQDIYNVENILSEKTDKRVQIIDIREFDESERLEIINQARLIHTEHPMIEQIFAQSMLEDLKIAMEEKKNVLERHRESGTCYLQ